MVMASVLQNQCKDSLDINYLVFHSSIELMIKRNLQENQINAKVYPRYICINVGEQL